jgi:hypothetical protein
LLLLLLFEVLRCGDQEAEEEYVVGHTHFIAVVIVQAFRDNFLVWSAILELKIGAIPKDEIERIIKEVNHNLLVE